MRCGKNSLGSPCTHHCRPLHHHQAPHSAPQVPPTVDPFGPLAKQKTPLNPPKEEQESRVQVLAQPLTGTSGDLERRTEPF